MKKLKTIADQNARMHLIGRLWLIGGMLLICTIPLWLSLYYDVEPMWEVFGSAAVISPFILMALSGIAEPIVYSPMVGINGMYLSFLTGNLSNLKIPCVVKAQEIAGTKRGTEEDEIVATIAVATSSLVTILIIGVIVLCLAVIPDLTQKIDDAKYLTPAFGCVVYALFGSLGGKYIVKNPKLAIGPIIIVVVVSIVLGVVGMDPGSAYLFVGIAVCLVSDVLIGVHFVSGVLSFLLAHVLLIVHLILQAQPTAWSLLPWAVLYGGLWAYYWRELPSLGKKAVPMCIYPIFLFGMFSLALALPFLRPGAASVCLALGAACFCVSDLVLGDGVVHERQTRLRDHIIMHLYEPAVFLFALSAVV